MIDDDGWGDDVDIARGDRLGGRPWRGRNVITGIGSTGHVCIVESAATHLVADMTGWFAT